MASTTVAAQGTDQFEIHVKQVGKGEEVLSFFIPSSSNVLDLKKKISTELQSANQDDVPSERQRLIFSGRMLRVDEENLKDARMKTDSVNCITLTPLPVGARPSARGEEEETRRGRAPVAAARAGGGPIRGTGQRRRVRMESIQAGLHPFAIALPRFLMSTRPASASSGAASASTESSSSTTAASATGGGAAGAAATSNSNSGSAPARERSGPDGVRVRAYAVSRSATSNEPVLRLLEGPEAGVMSSLLQRLSEGPGGPIRDEPTLAAMSQLFGFPAVLAAASAPAASTTSNRRAARQRRQSSERRGPEAFQAALEGSRAVTSNRRSDSSSSRAAGSASAPDAPASSSASSAAAPAPAPSRRRRASASSQQPETRELRRSTRRRTNPNQRNNTTSG